MKDILAKAIADILPRRVVLWVIIRAYALATVQKYPKLTPDEIGYSKLYKSWQ